MLSKLMLVGIAVIVIFMGTFVTTSEAGNPLVGYWSFDNGDVEDLSGNGNDGIIHGEPTLVEGKVGDALEFDGIDDWVEIPDSPSISEFDELSLSAWFKVTKPGGWRAILEKAVHEDWSYGFFIEENGNVSFYITQGENVIVCCIGEFPVEVGTWYHIAGTYDGSSAKCYVDGKLEGEMPASGPLNITTYPFSIGSRNVSNFFGGAIDEVTLWNKAVTVEEMQDPLAVNPLDKLAVTWAEIKELTQ